MLDSHKGGHPSRMPSRWCVGAAACRFLGSLRIQEVRSGEGCSKPSNKRDLVHFIPCGISSAQNSVCLVKDAQIAVDGGQAVNPISTEKAAYKEGKALSG